MLAEAKALSVYGGLYAVHLEPLPDWLPRP